MAFAYDYLFYGLERGRDAHAALGARLEALAGGEVLGRFTPQLGWSANEAAALVRWADGADREAQIERLMAGAPIVSATRRRLEPTLRPAEGARMERGGIYVHRWFTVASANEERFVELSGVAWPGFERQFATRIFGLFRAEPQGGETSFLLLTWYADHGVWEASRDPATEAREAFAQRQAITLRTRGCSTLRAEV